MDKIKNLNKEKSSFANKKIKHNNSFHKKRHSNHFEDIPLKKSQFSLKIKKEKDGFTQKVLGKRKKSKEKERSSKNLIENGKYFMKKILQMKKEIKTNEFSQISEDINYTFKSEDKLIKKIGTDLKQSLIILKNQSGYDFSSQNLEMIKSKTKRHDNKKMIISAFSKNNNDYKNNNTYNNNNINLNLSNSIGLEDDLSYGQLLINKNNNSDLLNNEEKKIY